MDSARILEDSGSPGRRPPRRRRWLVAAAFAVFAAPLASGSAIALNGSSGVSATSGGGGAPAVQEGWTAYGPKRDGKRPCRRGEKHRGGSSYQAPQM